MMSQCVYWLNQHNTKDNALMTFPHLDITPLSLMQAYATQIADLLTSGDCLLLQGSLGAGKTTFASVVIQHLTSSKVLTPSPTFALVHPYETSRGPLWHVDLYRLTSEEVPSLGLEEHWQEGLTLIEWPERLPFFPSDPLTLLFELEESTQKRHLSFKGSPLWHHRLTPLLTLSKSLAKN